MPKPPPKKREPTLRELLERDAKFPLPTIGINDDFNKTPVENAMGDIQDELTVNALLARGKQGYADFQRRQVPLGPPSEYNPNVPTPKPISTNLAKLLFDVLTMQSPAGERGDTELARIREANPELAQSRQRMRFINQVGQGFKPQYAPMDNLVDKLGARTNYGRNTPQEVYGMTALGGGPAYPRQGMMSKAMGVTNKKAGSK